MSRVIRSVRDAIPRLWLHGLIMIAAIAVCSCKDTTVPSVITGEVTLGNGPMPGVTLTLTSPRFGLLTATTNDEGVFTFPGIWGGTHLLRPSLPGYTFHPDTVFIDSAYPDIASIRFATVVTWARTFGWGSDEGAHDAVETADGGFIVAGYTNSIGSGSYDALVVKLDLYGDVEWYRVYGGAHYDIAWSVRQTADGGYIVAGGRETEFDSSQFWLLKIDAGGEVEWERRYGALEWDVARSVRQTADGGYVAAGYSDGSVLSDYLVMRLDPNGDLIWERKYGTGDFDRAYAVKEARDGGFIAAGSTEFFFSGPSEMWLLKLDYAGNEEWTKRYATGDLNEAHAVMRGDVSGYVAAGFTGWRDAGTSDIWVWGSDDEGTVLWSGSPFIEEQRRAFSLDRAVDGGYVIAGHAWTDAGEDRDICLVKTDGEGRELWMKRFQGVGSGPDEARAAGTTFDGGVIIAGKTSVTGSNDDMVIIKTDRYGEISGTRQGIR